MNRPFHAPVLVDQVIHYLITDPGGIYLDGTLGGGGHAERILEYLSSRALYIGLDQDEDALAYARKRLGHKKNIIFERFNFAEIPILLKQQRLEQIDGILLDLGISSFQIDIPQRGFSYMQDGPLDMRMDQRLELTADQIINRYPENELVRIFSLYGEERFAKRIARRIMNERRNKPINSTGQLRTIISQAVHGRQDIKSFARVFQALRIVVNNELSVLEKTLSDCLGYIKIHGRVVVISYHSLEDRIVKQFFKKQASPCTCPPELPQCICGLKPRVKLLTPKVVKPENDEIRKNVRARSAGLRAVEVL